MLNHRNNGNPCVDQDPADKTPGFASRISFAPQPPRPAEDDRSGGEDGCRLVGLNLPAYQDDALDPDTRNAVEAHLGHCVRCASNLEALRKTDEAIQREWRESAPLPSSLEVHVAMDAIMDALPPAPVETVEFAPKRVHARNRWTRFATGLASILTFGSLMWSSYRLGYADGRLSHTSGSMIQTPIKPGGYRMIQRSIPTFTSRSTASGFLPSPLKACSTAFNY